MEGKGEAVKFNSFMSKVIEGIKYADSHEWVKVEGNVGIIGISDYAQHSLGDIVYVDLPSEGDEISKGEEFGAVESVKAASDLYSPVSGTIIEINSELEASPELINQDAYENWIIKVELADPSEVDALLDAAAYEKICE